LSCAGGGAAAGLSVGLRLRLADHLQTKKSMKGMEENKAKHDARDERKGPAVYDADGPSLHMLK
jgi:hypothetical protein